jgi:predicted component of type VI protein secretion system
MSTLTLKLKDDLLGEFQLQDSFSLTIGRGGKNDVIIQDPAVSGHHAKIDPVGDRFVLIDLQSKNGTFVNENLALSMKTWLSRTGSNTAMLSASAIINSYLTSIAPNRFSMTIWRSLIKPSSWTPRVIAI